MPKSKTTTRTTKKTTKPKSARKTTSAAVKKSAVSSTRERGAKPTISKENYTDEYREYLERHEMSGEGRPKLGPAEFDRMDEEMWDLIDIETAQGNLNDEQTVRYRELEFMLLLDNEA